MIDIYAKGGKNPKQAAERIQSMISDFIFSLESVGDMTPELWCPLHDARQARKILSHASAHIPVNDIPDKSLLIH